MRWKSSILARHFMSNSLNVSPSRWLARCLCQPTGIIPMLSFIDLFCCQTQFVDIFDNDNSLQLFWESGSQYMRPTNNSRNGFLPSKHKYQTFELESSLYGIYTIRYIRYIYQTDQTRNPNMYPCFQILSKRH